MTVTKGKRNYSFPVNSGNISDVESLHVASGSASDTESLNNEPQVRSRPLGPSVVGNLNFEDPGVKRNSGRKKLRRYHNRWLLQTLAEEEETTDSVVIMEPYDSPFSKLLQDKDALQFWNDFIDKSEEEQATVIAAFGNKKETKNEVQKDKLHGKISSRIKRTFKIKKNLSLEQVKKSENDLIAFFKITPSQVYVKISSTYFERLLLHAIAQYHGLQSLGMIECGIRRVEVYNTTKNWIPADCFLSDFVAQVKK